MAKESPTYQLEEVEYATGGEYVVPQYKQSRQKNLQLVYNGYVYCRDSNRGLRVYWLVWKFLLNMKIGFNFNYLIQALQKIP